MTYQTIITERAPQAIGTYSQAVKTGTTVYLSGQIPLHPETMQLVGRAKSAKVPATAIREQVHQVFKNLRMVAHAAGGDLSDIVKLNVYLVDLEHFPLVNEAMAEIFAQPYPARAVIGVAALPKGAGVEIDAVMEITE